MHKTIERVINTYNLEANGSFCNLSTPDYIEKICLCLLTEMRNDIQPKIKAAAIQRDFTKTETLVKIFNYLCDYENGKERLPAPERFRPDE